MNIVNMNDHQFGLLFDVKRSIRYHDRRRSFYETMHRVTAFLTILMAGSIIFDIGKSGEVAWWLIALGILAALISASDMVLGYSSKADLHRNLKNAYIDLEVAIIAGDNSSETWIQHQISRLKIETDEPAVYRCLDLLCYNEIVLSMGLDKKNLNKLHFFKRLTRHFFYWSELSYQENSSNPPSIQTQP